MSQPFYRSQPVSTSGMSNVWVEVFEDRVVEREERSGVRQAKPGMPARSMIRAEVEVASIEEVAGEGGQILLTLSDGEEVALHCRASERDAVVEAIQQAASGEVPEESTVSEEATDSAETEPDD